MAESVIDLMKRVNELGLLSFITWLVETPVKGEAVSNAVWTALAHYVRVDLLKNNEVAYTRYCTSYSWSVLASGTIEDPDIDISIRCPETVSQYVFPYRFKGMLVISKKHNDSSINKNQVIAFSEDTDHKYVIAVNYSEK